MFTRTPGGLSEKWRFHLVPTVWVEGPTDIYFYEPVLNGFSCRIEAFHGVENARALVQALVDFDYPYAVILDGDYGILCSVRSPHSSVVILKRYSFENYLWGRDSFNKVCLRYARSGDDKDLVVTEMVRLEEYLRSKLTELVIHDIAARKSNSPPAVLPDKIEPLLVDDGKLNIDSSRVSTLVRSVKSSLESSRIEAAEAELGKFLKKGEFMHVLKGHIVLGILRKLLIQAVYVESEVKISITNDAFTQILSEMVWRQCESNQHKTLKRSLRRIARVLLWRYQVSLAPLSEV